MEERKGQKLQQARSGSGAEEASDGMTQYKQGSPVVPVEFLSVT